MVGCSSSSWASIRRVARHPPTTRRRYLWSSSPATRTPCKRIRRSAGDVESTAASVLAHVKANPGQGVTEIAAALRLSTKDLQLPILKLLGEKKLKTKGQRRGTKYFAGGRGSGSPKKASKKKAKRKTTKRRAKKKGTKKARRKTTKA